MNENSQPKPPLPGQPPSPPSGQPVAYDQYGRPLYAHPPQYPQAQVVHVARNIEPAEQPIPPEITQKHEESVRKFPHLNLTKGEYIISAIKRHPIGLVQIWGLVILLILAFGALFVLLFTNESAPGAFAFLSGSEEMQSVGLAVMGGLFVLILLGGLIATYVYESNRFYLTNESVIQEIQYSLFSKHEQTVNLSNIEDASYKQQGILQHLLDYGTIRLSTEGDETTYRFTYVGRPKRHIAVLNNAVEAFKSGRPVMPTSDQPS